MVAVEVAVLAMEWLAVVAVELMGGVEQPEGLATMVATAALDGKAVDKHVLAVVEVVMEMAVVVSIITVETGVLEH